MYVANTVNLYDGLFFVWHFLIQCETVALRNELTRVAVVNEQRECVYETLVKPRNKITNYLTKYVTSRLSPLTLHNLAE